MLNGVAGSSLMENDIGGRDCDDGETAILINRKETIKTNNRIKCKGL